MNEIFIIINAKDANLLGMENGEYSCFSTRLGTEKFTYFNRWEWNLLSFDQVSRIENLNLQLFLSIIEGVKIWIHVPLFISFVENGRCESSDFQTLRIKKFRFYQWFEEGLKSTFLCLLTVEDERWESTSFDFQALETEDMNLLASDFKPVKEWIYVFFFVYQPRMEDVNPRLETEIVNLRFFFSSIVDKNRISLSHVAFIKHAHVETLVISVRKVRLEFMEERLINDLCLQIKQNFFL